jgi:hypothetical protein
MLLSGAQLKAAQRYNQGMASQEFGNFFNRLQGLAGMGQNAAVQTGSFGANAAANQGSYDMMAGNARAQGITDQTNLALGGLGQLGGAYGQWSEERGSSGYSANDPAWRGTSPSWTGGGTYQNFDFGMQ